MSDCDQACYPGNVAINSYLPRQDRRVMAMEQIADWLQKRGMSEYAQPFIENRIDLSILPDLTDQDLEKLGVRLGDRRKMLARLPTSKISRKSHSRAVLRQPPRRSRWTQPSAAKSRCLFSDLVGSTALSAHIDPEDLREVVLAYQNVVAQTVRRFDGFVAEYHGDGVMVYFGYPARTRTTPKGPYRRGLS